MIRPTMAAARAPMSMGTTHDAMLTSAGSMLRVLPTIRSWSSMAMYAASRNSAPWAMLTVRIRPKINVNPEATTNIRPAKVIPSRSVTKNSPGSSIAAPEGVPVAKNSTQQTTNTIGRPTAMAGSRRLQVASIQFPLWCDQAPLPLLRAQYGPCDGEVQSRTSEIARFIGGGPKELDRKLSPG